MLKPFLKPTGEFGTVEQTNEDDALVKWDDDGRVRLHQPWLKKVSKKAHPLAKQIWVRLGSGKQGQRTP